MREVLVLKMRDKRRPLLVFVRILSHEIGLLLNDRKGYK